MKIFFMALMICLMAVPVHASGAAGDVAAGNRLFKQQKFPEARLRYESAARKDPAEARIEYDIATAAYKAGDFDAATDHFQKSLLTEDDHFRRDVHYNLGNAFYKAGMSREDKNLEQALQRLEGAVGSFEKALGVDPHDADAAHNRDFVKQEIIRLQQKQQQQKQQQKDGQQGKEQQPQASSSQDKKDGETPSSAEPKKDEENGSPSGEGQSKNASEEKKEPLAGQGDERQISSQKEANDLVDDFERNELPKGFLNFIHQVRDPRPVEKDW